MSCPEQRVVAFLAGELSEAEARQFDVHLLNCEACWRAVQEDRQGRAALMRLREPVPSDLADRVAMAVAVGGRSAASPEGAQTAPPEGAQTAPELERRPRRPMNLAGRRRFALSLASLATAAAVAAGVWLGVAGPGRSGGPSLSPQLASVLAFARSMSPSRPAGQGPTIVTQHQYIAVRYYRVEDQPVLVATSERDFPMPKHMHMAGSTPSDWMATQGKLGIYCVNAHHGRDSVLVVAAMPVEALPQVAADLHLL